MTLNVKPDRFPVMEAFYTIQGEGYHQGKAAFFIRLGGCDVGCHWCDVKESWNAEDHPEVTCDSLLDSAQRYPSKLVVVTGGEPMMYDLEMLTTSFSKSGFMMNLETSGAYPLSGSWDWICVSPKKFKPPLPDSLERADELKVIIYNHDDFKWAESFRDKVKPACKFYLQPEWTKMDRMMPYIVEYVKKDPAWEISLQSHKFINVP